MLIQGTTKSSIGPDDLLYAQTMHDTLIRNAINSQRKENAVRVFFFFFEKNAVRVYIYAFETRWDIKIVEISKYHFEKSKRVMSADDLTCTLFLHL